MTFKAEILLIGAAIAASLVIAHMLEGAGSRPSSNSQPERGTRYANRAAK